MKRVLVAVNLAGNALALMEYALLLSRQFRCRLDFMYSSESIFPTGISRISFEEAMRDEADANNRIVRLQLEKLCKRHNLDFERLEFGFRERFGNSATADILDASHEKHTDLILLSSHGRSGIGKVFLGSTASTLISRATVPVLVIPLNFNYQKITRLVYATDLTDTSEELRVLKPIARVLNSRIEMVNFNYGRSLAGKTPAKMFNVGFEEFTIDAARPLPENIRAYLAFKGGKGILLCMFSRHRNTFQVMFEGSITASTVEHLGVPLLSLPKPEVMIPVYN